MVYVYKSGAVIARYFKGNILSHEYYNSNLFSKLLSAYAQEIIKPYRLPERVVSIIVSFRQ